MLDTKISRVLYVGCITVFLTTLSCWALLAYQDSPVAASSPGRVPMTDEQFAKEAAQGGLAEVKLGQLAQERASNSTVQSFGERMVVEHSAAGDRLKEAASKANIALPTELAPKDEHVYNRLSKLSGADFDRAYAKDMVEDHQQDLVAFQQESSNGRNEEIKNFAAKTVPMLQEHLNQAREMVKTVAPSNIKWPYQSNRHSERGR